MKDRVTRMAAKELTAQTIASAPVAAMQLTIQATAPAVLEAPKSNTKRSLAKVEGNDEQDGTSLAGPSKKSKHGKVKHRKTKHRKCKDNKKGKGRAGDPIVIRDSEDEGEMFEEWAGLTAK